MDIMRIEQEYVEELRLARDFISLHQSDDAYQKLIIDIRNRATMHQSDLHKVAIQFLEKHYPQDNIYTCALGLALIWTMLYA